jgi:uncharacterized protein
VDGRSFEKAREYALHRLQQELPPGLYYHCVDHTAADVVPAAEALADGEGVAGRELLLLRTAAWYHDLGFIERRDGHEEVSVRIAAEALPAFGYRAVEVDEIGRLIMATAVPRAPSTCLEKIMADADLDVLGRDDFFHRVAALRRELAYHGKVFTEIEWLAGQIDFLGSHRYFTTSAQARREAGLARNLAALQQAFASQRS